jgi:hypothetical protein
VIGLASLALVGAMGISGSVEAARPCPPACATTINVQMTPRPGGTGERGRYFLGVFPVEHGQVNTTIGGYWTGQGWAIGQVPVSFRQGPLAPFTQRVVIQEGLCALARNAGASGTFAIMVGYGHDVLMAQTRDIDALEQALNEAEGPNVAELQGIVNAFRETAAKDPRIGDVMAAQDMRERGTMREIGRVTCQ